MTIPENQFPSQGQGPGPDFEPDFEMELTTTTNRRSGSYSEETFSADERREVIANLNENVDIKTTDKSPVAILKKEMKKFDTPIHPHISYSISLENPIYYPSSTGQGELVAYRAQWTIDGYDQHGRLIPIEKSQIIYTSIRKEDDLQKAERLAEAYAKTVKAALDPSQYPKLTSLASNKTDNFFKNFRKSGVLTLSKEKEVVGPDTDTGLNPKRVFMIGTRGTREKIPLKYIMRVDNVAQETFRSYPRTAYNPGAEQTYDPGNDQSGKIRVVVYDSDEDDDIESENDGFYGSAQSSFGTEPSFDDDRRDSDMSESDL